MARVLYSQSDAVISLSGVYRYRLDRKWSIDPGCMFIMLNPSTADETKDDPTIRRCVSFAKTWGYGSLRVGNLFAIRCTDPKDIEGFMDPEGPSNDSYLLEMAEESDLVVAAWGARGGYLGRDTQVMELIGHVRPLHVLGFTKQGHPRHPLYMRADCIPERWIA